MNKNHAVIIRSLRVASKFTYSTISILMSGGGNPDYKWGEKLCNEAKDFFPEDDAELWQMAQLGDEVVESNDNDNPY